MPGVARIVGPSGCCPCGQQSGCSCAGSGSCTLQCQSKGGIGTLIGFSEFTSPSTPPKKYLNIEIDYDFLGCVFSSGNPTCAPQGNVFIGSYHNINANGGYDATTAVFTPASAKACGTVGDPCVAHEIGCSPFDVVNPPGSADGPNVVKTVDTQTQQVWEAIEGCHVGAESLPTTATGGFSQEISNEDTEENAIIRANAPQEWASSNCLSAPAFMTQRTTGFTFEYNHVQSRVHLSGLINHHTYDVTTFFYRRAQGSTGPWIFFSLNTQGVTVLVENGDDPDNLDTEWVDVPNEPDFETRAQSCLVEDVTL